MQAQGRSPLNSSCCWECIKTGISSGFGTIQVLCIEKSLWSTAYNSQHARLPKKSLCQDMTLNHTLPAHRLMPTSPHYPLRHPEHHMIKMVRPFIEVSNIIELRSSKSRLQSPQNDNPWKRLKPQDSCEEDFRRKERGLECWDLFHVRPLQLPRSGTFCFDAAPNKEVVVSSGCPVLGFFETRLMNWAAIT